MMDNFDQDPPENEQLSRSRRRRARRQLLNSLSTDEKAAYLEEVVARSAPTFDFFFFSLLAGIVMALGFFFDSPYLLVLGAALTPLLAPLVGVSLGVVLGAVHTFFRSMGGLMIGALLILIIGIVFGLFGRLVLPGELVQAYQLTQLHWSLFLVLPISAAFTTALLIKDQFARVFSTVTSFCMMVPISAAGFGLGVGNPDLWINGLVLFVIYLTLAVLTGFVYLLVKGFRPYSIFGYSIGGVITLVGVILLLGFGGAGAVVGGQVGLPTQPPTATITHTPTLTVTATPLPPTETFTPTITPTLTISPTPSKTPSPTPVEALIAASDQAKGALLRDAPASTVMYSLINGWLVIILPDDPVYEDGSTWVHVLDVENNRDGWVQANLLATATQAATQVPAATLTPSATRTTTPTPSPATTAAE